MATLTGKALLDAALEETGASVTGVSQDAMVSRLDQIIANGDGNISSLAIAGVLGGNAGFVLAIPEGETPVDYLKGVSAAAIDTVVADDSGDATLITIAAEAAYAEFTLPADATPGEKATANALTLTTAEAAIAGGATQAEIDAEYDAIVEAGADAITLANVVALDAAQTAVKDFLAAVDTDVVDPATFDDDEDDDADAATTATDATPSSDDVHDAYADAVLAYNGAVTGADIVNDSATTATALYNAALSALNAELDLKEAAVTDVEAAIAALPDLGAAITALAAKTVIEDAAKDAVATASDDLAIALATFDVKNGDPVGTTALQADGTDDATTDVLITLDTNNKLVLVAGVTETTKPGITAVLNASIAKEAADATLDVATTAVNTAQTAVTASDPSTLVLDLATAEDAVFDDNNTPDDTSDDGGAQVDVDALIAVKADYDALVVIDKALTALEDTASDAAALVDDLTLVSGDPTADAAPKDFIVFVSNLVAEDTVTIDSYDADADSLYFGDAFTFNPGALTTGDIDVLEMFITEGSTAADSLITFETALFGSDSTGDFFTVELTGVAVADLAVLDGMIVGA